MSFRTPRARVSGLGSAGTGTEHWWSMRLTSVALIPLSVLFVLPFAGMLGQEYGDVLAHYANPWHAIVAMLFLAVGFHHLMQGLQVVIEDYVHHKGWRTALMMGNSFFCVACAFAGIFSVLKIAFIG